MRKAYKFKLYRSKRNRHLDNVIDISGGIWNHCIALHRRYYKMYGKYPRPNHLKNHIVKRRPQYKHWNLVDAQAIQDIVERVDRAYKLFFKNIGKASPPRFRKIEKYKSITLKQNNYKIHSNKLIVQRRQYKYHGQREIEGKIKTVTIKRTMSGYYLFVSVEIEDQPINRIETGKIAGADFGLKTFLVFSDGKKIRSPEFFKQSLLKTRLLSKKVSSKKKGSNNRKKAVSKLAKHCEQVGNKRSDFFFKLARDLTETYDYIFLEDLNLEGMKKKWGRKVSDLAFGEFVHTLEYQATKNGCVIKKIGRYFPSTKLCNQCGYKNNDLTLRDRSWVCSDCRAEHDRDLNASKNILREGASSLGLGDVRPVPWAVAV